MSHFPAASTLSVLNLFAATISALIGHPEFAPVFVVVAALFLGVHTQVVLKEDAFEMSAEAAEDAALETAANLTELTVGGLGEITQDGYKVVGLAVKSTVL